MTELIRSESANELFKDGFQESLAYALMLATVVHLFVFAMWPTMEADIADTARNTDVTLLELPEDIPLPAPPVPILRPAMPVVSADAPADATIERVAFADVPDLLPPPPDVTPSASRSTGTFTPYTVGPSLDNPEEFQRALRNAYPRTLRDSRIGGTVQLRLRVDESGRVTDAEVVEPSAYEAFDEAALALVDVMRFNPALNLESRVAVWVTMPIHFSVQ